MHWLESWLLPATSVLSGKEGDNCDLTMEEIAALPRLKKTCPQCAMPSLDGLLCGSCQHHPPDFDQTQVGFYFQEPITQLIYDLKYHQQMSHARLLSELFWLESEHSLIAQKVEALIPVPIHPLRRRERGYNQALLIAEELSKLSGIPVLKNTLQRVKYTESQTHLDALQRQNNLKGAFSLERDALDSLSRIAIVDDVVTTGATMNALASLIKAQSSIDFVSAWAIARTKPL